MQLLLLIIIVIIKIITTEKIENIEFILKQKAIFTALEHSNQYENIDNDMWKTSQTFIWTSDIWKHIEKSESAKEWKMYIESNKFIGKYEIFSIMNTLHRNEAIALFNIFYYIDDWQIFYNVMSWSRFNLNEGVFRYALNLVVIHKAEFYNIILPQPYETKPFYYFDSYVIQKVQSLKMKGFPKTSDFVKVDEDDDTYTILIPSSSSIESHSIETQQNESETLKYYTEDVDLNAFYYWFNLNYPSWMSGKEFGLDKDRRGELYWFGIRQLVARYEMERYSHNMDKISELDYTNQFITQGYQSQLCYYNGTPFPTRHSYRNYKKSNIYDLIDIEDYERYVRDAIKWGFVHFPNGKSINFTDPQSIEALTEWFLGTPDSPFNVHKTTYGYHEMMVKRIIGGSRYNVPTHLEHYDTSLRDPLFYVIYKRWLQTIYLEWMKQLPSYNYDDLHYDGVKIESVSISKLMTYYKIREYDITNAIDVSPYETTTFKKGPLFEYGRTSHYHGQDLVIKVQRKQLNHIPFTITMNVSSKEKQKVFIKIYLGPDDGGSASSVSSADNEYSTNYYLNVNQLNWFLFDEYMIELNEGKNILTRNCTEFSSLHKTHTTFYNLYKQLLLSSSTATNAQFPVDKNDLKYNCGYPAHLLLPHGKVDGIPYQFFIIIVPYIEPSNRIMNTNQINCGACGVDRDFRYTDNLSIGFPFDRQINLKYWNTPNMHYHKQLIFHKNGDV